MGRPLFSTKYESASVDCEESSDAEEKWSASNQFDPDSEEFFKDAQLEYFIDVPTDTLVSDTENEERTGIFHLPNFPIIDGVPQTTIASNDSPMAIGADDPVSLLAGAYTPGDWQQRFLEASSDVRRRHARVPSRSAVRRVHRREYSLESTSFEYVGRRPPDFLSGPDEPVLTSLSRSPRSSRTVNITPITIPSEPSPPSPVFAENPSTPSSPRMIYPITNTYSPSPASNVTPRLYSWGPSPYPTSPTRDSTPRSLRTLNPIDIMPSSHQHIPVFEY